MIIQQIDTLDVVKKDSNNSFLELMKAEDSSVIQLPKKKVTTINPITVSNTTPLIVEIPTDTLIQDSASFVLRNTNKIPIRKTTKPTHITLEQKKNSFEPSLRISNNTTWPTIVLTVSLLLLAFTKAFGANRLRQIYKSLFSYYSAHEIIREEKVFFHQVNFILFLVYLLTLSLLLYFVTLVVDEGLYSSFLYPMLLIGVLVVYAIKFVFSFLLAYLFDFSQHVATYSYNVLLYNYLLGIVLIPCVSLIYFSKFNSIIILQTVILPIICITLLIRFIRFFVIGISNKISYFYIILYICTLEILPLVVLGKFFIF